MHDLVEEPKGMKAGVELAVSTHAAERGDDFVSAEQLALLPLRQTHASQGGGSSTELTRGPGRPIGAKNKRTQDWADYLLSKYRSPLEGLAEIYSRSVEEIARELGFSVAGPGNINTRTASPQERLEILKIQIACMDKLAPYIHQKMPTAIDTGGDGFLNLFLNVDNGKAKEAEAEALTLELIDVTPENESQQNQQVSEAEPPNSNGSHSNGQDQVTEPKRKRRAKRSD